MPVLNAFLTVLLGSLLLHPCYGQGNSLKRMFTLDLGAPDAPTTTAAGVAMPTGSNVAIHEDSDGGYSLYLGDLVHTDLTTRAAANCGADNDGCEDSIQDGLLNAGYDLQSRAVGLLLIAGGIILASFAHILIELYKDSQQVPQIVHITGPEVSSIKGAADDVTGVVLQTAANDAGVAVPITQVPTGPVSASAGTITSTINPSTITVTPVTLQTIAAGWELEFTSEGSKELAWLQTQAKQPCTGSKKRQIGGCAVYEATAAMNALPLALMNLLTIGRVQLLPRLVTGGDLYNAVQAIFDSGRAIVALVAVSDDTLWTLAEMFLIMFDEDLNKAVPIAATNTLPASDFAAATGAVTATQSGPCATGSDTPACPDADCSGDPISAATCTVKGTNSGCSCAPIVTPYIYTGDPTWLDTQQTILGSMMKLGSLPMSAMAAKPTCLSDGAPWFSPSAWCDCGVSSKYPTMSGKSGSAACSYSVLPTAMITPVSNGVAPTNVPGQNGLPACAFVSYPDGQACPNANYCNCDGIAVKPLPAVVNGVTTSNCNGISIQPTVNDCPTPTTTIAPVSKTSAATMPSLSCNPTGGTDYVLFDRTKALNQITKICTDFHNDKVVLSQNGISLPPSQYDTEEQIDGAAASGATLVMNPVWSLEACEDQNNPTEADFGAWTVDQCVGYFMTAVDSCPNFSNPSGTEFWKIGGTNFDACTFWTVRAEAG